MRYNSRRGRPAIRSRMTGRSVEPPRREGQGLVLLMAQTVLCVAALAVVFTMQYVKPREYKMLGEYYTEITREDGDKQDEVMRLLATPIPRSNCSSGGKTGSRPSWRRYLHGRMAKPPWAGRSQSFRGTLLTER